MTTSLLDCIRMTTADVNLNMDIKGVSRQSDVRLTSAATATLACLTNRHHAQYESPRRIEVWSH